MESPQIFVLLAVIGAALLSQSVQADDRDSDRQGRENSEPKVFLTPGRGNPGYYVWMEFGERLTIRRRDVERFKCRDGFLVAESFGSRRFRVECK